MLKMLKFHFSTPEPDADFSLPRSAWERPAQPEHAVCPGRTQNVRAAFPRRAWERE